ncbi:Hypothetical protein SMAX5B_005175 [Scophthalmus maximus]|uniref:Uncharacterized protein n=1 Tax=Scophthalmus maximus TaxID=52904 RepID=A0A2U9BEP1_SCOMX|nr:Hypothetical protein SMAX5B_005175 [Scophthalmus maximus]
MWHVPETWEPEGSQMSFLEYSGANLPVWELQSSLITTGTTVAFTFHNFPLSAPLEFFEFLLFLLPDVAVSWDRYIYHNCLLLFFIAPHENHCEATGFVFKLCVVDESSSQAFTATEEDHTTRRTVIGSYSFHSGSSGEVEYPATACPCNLSRQRRLSPTRDNEEVREEPQSKAYTHVGRRRKNLESWRQGLNAKAYMVAQLLVLVQLLHSCREHSWKAWKSVQKCTITKGAPGSEGADFRGVIYLTVECGALQHMWAVVIFSVNFSSFDPVVQC